VTEQLQVKQVGNQELIFGNDIVIYDAAVTACTTIGYELGNLNGEIANLIKDDWTLSNSFWSTINDAATEGSFILSDGESVIESILGNNAQFCVLFSVVRTLMTTSSP